MSGTDLRDLENLVGAGDIKAVPPLVNGLARAGRIDDVRELLFHTANAEVRDSILLALRENPHVLEKDLVFIGDISKHYQRAMGCMPLILGLILMMFNSRVNNGRLTHFSVIFRKTQVI